jgi:hypothetical protein
MAARNFGSDVPMLELTEAQLRQMRQHAHAGFVNRVHAELLTAFPELAQDAGLHQRLGVAHERALALGLDSGTARTQFLYQEAFTPGFCKQQPVIAWLTRPGAAPEQRWRDFMALTQVRLGLTEPQKG